MPILYPRALVVLSGVVAGRDFQTTVVPESVTVTEQPVTHAATCEVTVHGSSLPFRGRQLAGLAVAVYMAAAERIDADIRDQHDYKKNLRFIGVVDEREREEGEQGPVVKLHCRDLSAALRDQKPVFADAIPYFLDHLDEALQRLLDSVPGAGEQLSLRASELLEQPLGRAVGKRGGSSRIPVPKTTTSTWEVVERAADLAGVLVGVELDELVVRRPSDVFGEPGTPDTIPVAFRFVFGGPEGNLLSVSDRQKFLSNRKGLRVISFDPETRTPIEVLYPPDGQLPPRRLPKGVTGKVTKPKKHKAKTSTAQEKAPERETITAFGIHKLDVLLEHAKRLWLERANNETSATIMTSLAVNGTLSLRSGDLVVAQVHPELEAGLRNLPDEHRKIEVLEARLLVSEDAARLLLLASDKHDGEFFRVRTCEKTIHANQRPEVKAELISLFPVEL